jgi:two-component sensor histidine kinase
MLRKAILILATAGPGAGLSKLKRLSHKIRGRAESCGGEDRRGQPRRGADEPAATGLASLDQEGIMTELESKQTVPLEWMLLNEFNHRINNEFAAAIGLVSLAAARSANNEVKTTLSGVAELLQRYSEVHRALQMPESGTVLDAQRYLRRLCFTIRRSYLDYRKIKLLLETEPLDLEADRCWRLGMIVYELILNSARHAFGGGDGEIRIELLRVRATVICAVIDNGSVAATGAPGRGLRIVGQLSKSLGGRLVQKLGPRGSRSILSFPRDSAAAPAANVAAEGFPIGAELLGLGRTGA